MVDADDYVSGSTVEWGSLIATFISSLILLLWGGVTTAVTEFARIPSESISALFGAVGMSLEALLRGPASTIALAWNEAARAVPSIGPGTFVLGVLIVAATYYLQSVVLDRVREVITG